MHMFVRKDGCQTNYIYASKFNTQLFSMSVPKCERSMHLNITSKRREESVGRNAALVVLVPGHHDVAAISPV